MGWHEMSMKLGEMLVEIGIDLQRSVAVIEREEKRRLMGAGQGSRVGSRVLGAK